MAKRVFWKKGMRLTDDVLRLSDAYHAELVGQAVTLSAAGRFGLLPSTRPFRLSLDINKNMVEVVAADFVAVTRSGQLIDVSYDSRFSEPRNSTVTIPSGAEGRAFLLLATASGEWRDTNDGSCEAICQYNLQEENVPLTEDSVPLARIVFDNGWREDDMDFVPPCLLLSSHQKFVLACNEFRDLLSRLDVMVPERLATDTGDACRVFWPEVRRLSIVMDKETDIMSPMSLLARIQECVSSFYCACTMDECLDLSDGDKFLGYSRRPYNFKDVYRNIVAGLRLTSDICKKLEDFEEEQPAPAPGKAELSAPVIVESELHQFAVSNDVRVEVSGLAPGASAFYSVDGLDPAKPLQGGHYVPLNPGFNKTRTKENDRSYIIKLKAVLDGESSIVTTYEVIVTKDVNVWKGFQI